MSQATSPAPAVPALAESASVSLYPGNASIYDASSPSDTLSSSMGHVAVANARAGQGIGSMFEGLGVEGGTGGGAVVMGDVGTWGGVAVGARGGMMKEALYYEAQAVVDEGGDEGFALAVAMPLHDEGGGVLGGGEGVSGQDSAFALMSAAQQQPSPFRAAPPVPPAVGCLGASFGGTGLAPEPEVSAFGFLAHDTAASDVRMASGGVSASAFSFLEGVGGGADEKQETVGAQEALGGGISLQFLARRGHGGGRC